jgi:hypothetical protein
MVDGGMQDVMYMVRKTLAINSGATVTDRSGGMIILDRRDHAKGRERHGCFGDVGECQCWQMGQ